MGGIVTKILSEEMTFSWHLEDEMELAPERYREIHSKQKEQKAERPQESLAVVRKRKKAQEAGMKELEMQIPVEEHSSWKD